MNYFASAASWLIESGVINFLVPFLLSFTFFFVLFERIKLSTSKILNAVMSFSIALLIFIFPLVSGIDISIALSYFLAQAFSFIFVFVVGMLIASLFYPDFPQKLSYFFRTRSVLFGMIGLVIALFVTSGLLTLIFQSYSAPTQKTYDREGFGVAIIVALLLIFAVLLLISSRIYG